MPPARSDASATYLRVRFEGKLDLLYTTKGLSHCRLPQRQRRLITQALHPRDIFGRERARPVRAYHDHGGRVEHGQHQHRLAVFREVVELDLPRESLRAAGDETAVGQTGKQTTERQRTKSARSHGRLNDIEKRLPRPGCYISIIFRGAWTTWHKR